jgi:hypothetical protein
MRIFHPKVDEEHAAGEEAAALSAAMDAFTPKSSVASAASVMVAKVCIQKKKGRILRG